MIVHCFLLLSITAYSYAVSGGIPVSTIQYENIPLKGRLAGADHKNGVAAAFQFPDLMSLTHAPESGSETFIGQASIIAANMTITAASCFWDMESDTMMTATEVKLYGGSLEKGPPEARAAIGSPIEYAVKNIIIHPGFAFYPLSQVFEKDIALVVPETNLTLKQVDPGPYMRAIALSTKRANSSNTFDGKTKGITPSWGKTAGGSGVAGSEATEVNFVQYPFAKHTDCVAAYQKATTGSGIQAKSSPYTVQPFSLCMNTTQGKGLCMGDTGAAVRVVQSKVARIHGIASKIMTDACPPKRHDLYTRVSYFVNWIQAKGGPKAL